MQGGTTGGVHHVLRLQIERCGELDPEGSLPARLLPGCCRNKCFGVGLFGGLLGGLFMPECSGGRYSVVFCNSPFRGGGLV